MLADAAGAFLDSLGEREFDEPLKALLRSKGYYDIHLVHGPAEAGKDIIAKLGQQGAVEQWAVQSKAGDVGLSEWREIRGQLDELRTSDISHPSFETDLPRRAVLAMTGRLVGQAPVQAQEYRKRIRELGELDFEVWDRDQLVADLTETPSTAIGGNDPGGLYQILGQIEGGEVDDRIVERFSRRWAGWAPAGTASVGVLEAAMLCKLLADAERLDLACMGGLGLVRGAWAGAAAADDVEAARPAAEAGGKLFDLYAERLWDGLGEEALDPNEAMKQGGPPGWFTYPVWCVKMIEILGLWCLRWRESEDSRAIAVEDFLAEFTTRHAGASHPLSDHWAVSIIPPAVAMCRSHECEARALLTSTASWLCDRYEKTELGLAAAWASPEEEIDRCAGGSLDHIERERRAESHLAAILLDLSALLRERKLYEDLRNDVLALDIHPAILHVKDGPGQFVLSGENTSRELNPPYRAFDDAPLAPHHDPEPLLLEREGLLWDQLAIQSVVRDRHFFTTMRELTANP